ncbi:MAG: hypothetical protein CLLPBCKN_007060 [Chroococcidiopsis cubana SAG 39.79]|nr:hypothetical protein [Chroococcidiopsis cubana SAG 39.79]
MTSIAAFFTSTTFVSPVPFGVLFGYLLIFQPLNRLNIECNTLKGRPLVYE